MRDGFKRGIQTFTNPFPTAKNGDEVVFGETIVVSPLGALARRDRVEDRGVGCIGNQSNGCLANVVMRAELAFNAAGDGKKEWQNATGTGGI